VRQKNDIAKLIANVVGLSLAGGVAGRLGLSAARSLQPKALPYDVAPEANIIKMKSYKHEEDEEDDVSPYKKVASFNPIQILADLIHKGDPANPGESTGILSGNKNPHITGGNATGSMGLFGTAPAWASIPLGLAGLYGGWKLTDYVMDKRRKAELEEELEDVKSRYDSVASSAFSKDSSADMSVDETFDKLAEFMTQPSLTKQADNPIDTISGIGGAAVGVGATYAVLAALLAGYGSHSLFSGRSRRKLIEDALKERQSGKPAIPYTTYETPESLLPDFEEEDEDSADEVSAGSDTDTQNAAVLKFN